MKNQVDKNKMKKKQSGANLAANEQPADCNAKRLVLPLGQTIFLPQTAMGVSYIDKVRTRVYLDSLQRRPEAVCLRGFYEIDLEYHGLEGNRLYKHRVMLPLRVELPADWLAPLEYEPEELHVVITRPMLGIISPYVLEFNAGLAVEYVGDHMCSQCKPAAAQSAESAAIETAKIETAEIEAAASATGKNETNSIEMQQAEVQQRLESKFGSPDKQRPAAELIQEVRAQAVSAPAEVAAEKAVAPTAEDKAGAQGKYHLPVWTGSREPGLAVAAKTEAEPVNSRLTAKAEELAQKAAAQAAAEQPLVKPVAGQPAAEKAAAGVKQTAAKPNNAAEFALPQFEQGKLRSVLTVAAISRLQAKGEALAASGKNQPQEVILLEPQTEATAKPAEMPISVQVAAEPEPVAAAEAAEAAETVKAAEVEVETVAETITETVAENPAAPAAVAVDNEAVNNEVADNEVESATENVVSENVVSENVVPETSATVAVMEPEPAAEVMADKAAGDYADELAAAVAAAVHDEAADNAETSETVEAAAESLADGSVKAVNADGVRLRVGLRDAQKIRPVPRPAGDNAAESKTAGSFCMKYYVVKPGDDPMSIALKHNVPLERLRESNKALAGDLSVGMVLRIPS